MNHIKFFVLYIYFSCLFMCVFTFFVYVTVNTIKTFLISMWIISCFILLYEKVILFMYKHHKLKTILMWTIDDSRQNIHTRFHQLFCNLRVSTNSNIIHHLKDITITSNLLYKSELLLVVMFSSYWSNLHDETNPLTWHMRGHANDHNS